jgi:hypothetical protein
VISGVDTNFDGTNNDRPNVVGIPSLGNRSRAQNIAMYFNTAAFAQTPARQPYGNAQFDLLFGPKYVDTDLSAFKSFPIHDDWMLQFRAEAFNVINNVNLSNPAANLTSAAQFGKITAANSPRILQFALRLSF